MILLLGTGRFLIKALLLVEHRTRLMLAPKRLRPSLKTTAKEQSLQNSHVDLQAHPILALHSRSGVLPEENLLSLQLVTGRLQHPVQNCRQLRHLLIGRPQCPHHSALRHVQTSRDCRIPCRPPRRLRLHSNTGSLFGQLARRAYLYSALTDIRHTLRRL